MIKADSEQLAAARLALVEAVSNCFAKLFNASWNRSTPENVARIYLKEYACTALTMAEIF